VIILLWSLSCTHPNVLFWCWNSPCLLVELWALLSCHCQAPAWTLVGNTALRKTHEDSNYTAMIAIMHWHLGAETHPGGEVVSTGKNFCLPSGRHCSLARSTQTLWSSRVQLASHALRLIMRLEYELVDASRVYPGVHNVGVLPATRSAVATWKSKQTFTTGCSHTLQTPLPLCSFSTAILTQLAPISLTKVCSGMIRAFNPRICLAALEKTWMEKPDMILHGRRCHQSWKLWYICLSSWIISRLGLAASFLTKSIPRHCYLRYDAHVWNHPSYYSFLSLQDTLWDWKPGVQSYWNEWMTYMYYWISFNMRLSIHASACLSYKMWHHFILHLPPHSCIWRPRNRKAL